jgi:hypothetical protein
LRSLLVVASTFLISAAVLIPILFIGFSTPQNFNKEATSVQNNGRLQTMQGPVVESEDDFIPLSSGSFVIIYEQTGEVTAHNFSVSEIVDRGCVFTTDANEWYFLTSEGDYLDIHCFRANRLSGGAVGNNIVAVRLDGVPEHPEGIWASRIINYTLGYNGIEDSINNALGPDTQLGPYQDRLATLLGDQLSDMILGF